MRNAPIKRNVEAIAAWLDKSRRTSTLGRSTLAPGPGPAHKPMKPRTKAIRPKKRTKAETERIYGSPDRIAWSKAQPCVACGATPTAIIHVKSGGMGRKADASDTTHLCDPCHDLQHTIGIPAFEARYSISLAACAAESDARWQALNDQ